MPEAIDKLNNGHQDKRSFSVGKIWMHGLDVGIAQETSLLGIFLTGPSKDAEQNWEVSSQTVGRLDVSSFAPPCSIWTP